MPSTTIALSTPKRTNKGNGYPPSPASSALGSPFNIAPRDATRSPSSHIGSDKDDDEDDAAADCAKHFALQRALVDLGGKDIPHVNIVSVGAQSCAKSSLLSEISGIPLHSAGELATHYETKQPFTCKIEIHFNHDDRMFPFAEGIKDRTEVQEAAWLAGEEARRCGNNIRDIKNLEELKALPLNERNGRYEGCDEFTENVVVITAEGSGLRNIAMIDLPGLHNSKLRPEALVRKYISRPQNFIVLCLAAGGSDQATHSDLTEVKLVAEADSDGHRTMGYITKADLIDDANANTFSRIISGTNKDFKFHPDHGWWPVTLHFKTNRLTTNQINKNFNELFHRPDWSEFQKNIGREFGFEQSRTKLIEIFEDRVADNFGKIKTIFNEKRQALALDLERLPREIEDPVSALNDALHVIIRDLRQDCLNSYTPQDNDSPALPEPEKREAYKTLMDLQCQLEEDLSTHKAEFLPYDKGNSQGEKEYKSLVIMVETCEAKDKVYIKDIVDDIKKIISKRHFKVKPDIVFEMYRLKYLPIWRKLALTYVDGAWTAVEQAVEHTCEGSGLPRKVGEQVLNLLKSRIMSYKRQSIYQASRRCDRLILSPEDTSVITPQNKRLYDKHLDHLTKWYRTLHPATNESPWPLECIEIQAYLCIHLDDVASDIGGIGREVQHDICQFLEIGGLHTALRKGFELDNLEDGQRVLKRCRSLFQGDAALKRRRAEVMKRKKNLDAIQKEIGSLTAL